MAGWPRAEMGAAMTLDSELVKSESNLRQAARLAIQSGDWPVLYAAALLFSCQAQMHLAGGRSLVELAQAAVAALEFPAESARN